MTTADSTAGPLSRVRERAGVRARALRQVSPDAERRLWRALRNRQIGGAKFRRQHPIGRYFGDFACVEAGLVIELDGGQHFTDEGMKADALRTRALNANGFTVLRFTDREALVETQAVLERIHQWLAANHPHPNPLPPAGEGADTTSTPGPFAEAGASAQPTPSPARGRGQG